MNTSPNKVKKPLRPAATVILARPCEKKGSSEDFEILMIQRSHSSSFFAGAYAFPGGVIENADFDPKWKGWIGNDRTQSSEGVEIDHEGKKLNELGFRIGAIREIFEEVNILLARTKNKDVNVQELNEFRPKIHNDAEENWKMAQKLSIYPAVDQLLPFSHWITPLAEGSRYNTLFYVALMKPHKEATGHWTHLMTDASHDQMETVNMKWVSPLEALKQFDSKQVFLPPPTWLTIKELSEYKTLDHLQSLSKFQFGRDIPVRLPLLTVGDKIPNQVREEMEKEFQLDKKGKMAVTTVFLPGDELHPDSKERNKNRRNRIVVTAEKEEPSPKSWEYFFIEKQNETSVSSKL